MFLNVQFDTFGMYTTMKPLPQLRQNIPVTPKVSLCYFVIPFFHPRPPPKQPLICFVSL